ncbi:acyl-CoA synthetase [Mangrovactinospora gilvigrisea]|uniref:Acyl-CoA synthetase n=1 Tax=Mangrovactinospora gilvigrisea TaxID=1428644 RepID=A0A1J7CDE4_9ACTN|nr:AMP-binding protein [Mangrovactinospora gilvigrisea]OIV37682.1 acyl-CoA synthetase [Mangrovactinospora gilvigrisea]
MRLLSALYASPADAPALAFGASALRRGQLLDAAHALAARLAGAPAVAVHAEAAAETAVAAVAALAAGVPLVPVPADAGPGERDHILKDSGAALLLARPGAWDGNAPDDLPVPVEPVRLNGPAGNGNRPLPAEPDPASPALILYTSGTTGAPKGVVLSRAALAADIDALAAAWQWTADDTLVHGLPLFHVHGLAIGTLGALRIGSPLIHTLRPRPAAYAAAREAGGTLFFGVPTVWTRLVREPDAARALAGARLLVSGSAPLPVPVFERMRALTGQPPVERYGMTETLLTVSTRADGERRPGHVGLPVDGVRTRLAAEDGGAVPHDGESVGELLVTGPTLFDGYLNRPEATAAARTADGWFRTGDVAVIGADGFHRIVGRASTDLIKSGGFRIGAGEIEDALRGHAGVADAAVVGVPDDDLGQRVVAYVVPDGGVTAEELTSFAAERVSRHKVPREVVFVDDLPRNAMGKVQKRKLVEGS